eukprot:TRINITY_DN6135_c0_g1_i3.p1 TRINITY_DN6135_c0_g1~~TRINITY_DN6135_c0_g1_i3.p1  ORF type:complete len:305 (+),score=72.00 TRINITY_DN6135_c0_g1_i3:207-1121(+)
MSEETKAQLQEKIKTYREQLSQVDVLLSTDPSSPEFNQLKNDLQDLLNITQDLLLIKEKEEQSQPKPARVSKFSLTEPLAPVATAGSSTAPAHPLLGPTKGLLQFKVGSECEAKWSEDETWYKAVITEVLPGGSYKVTFSEYGNSEIVRIDAIRPVSEVSHQLKNYPEEKKRITAPDAFLPIPKSLKILPTDPEDVKDKKKKKIHAIKSANRLKVYEESRAKSANSWKSFQEGLGSKKKPTGAISDMRKESIFRTNEGIVGSKVGVTGSGKPMTASSHLNKEKFLNAHKKLQKGEGNDDYDSDE